MQDITEQYRITLPTLETLPSGEFLTAVVENPHLSLLLSNVDKPERTQLAEKMIENFKEIERLQKLSFDQLKYKMILAANLMFYFNREEDDQEADYGEALIHCYKNLEETCPLNAVEKIEWNIVIGDAYNMVEDLESAASAYVKAITLLNNEPDKNYDKIGTCFKKNIELHIERAAYYDIKDPLGDAGYVVYLKAIELTKEALKTLSESTEKEKFYYYMGKTHYLIAEHHHRQANTNVLTVLNTATSELLNSLTLSASLNRQKETLAFLQKCCKLFIRIISSNKENIPSNNFKYAYSRLNSLFIDIREQLKQKKPLELESLRQMASAFKQRESSFQPNKDSPMKARASIQSAEKETSDASKPHSNFTSPTDLAPTL